MSMHAAQLWSAPHERSSVVRTDLRSAAFWKSAALRHGFVALLLSTTVFERVGLNFGSYSLNTAMLGIYGFLVTATLTRALVLSVSRLVLYGACLALAIASAIVNEQRMSGTSLLLLSSMYLPYVFVVREGSVLGRDRRWVTDVFSNTAVFCALAGIVQFYAQFIIHAPWLFDFTESLPAFLRGPAGYNTVIPVGTRFKSNGFFFREPSGFSFIMALALIGEIMSRRRAWRLAIFGLALLLTYSGTGLLALIIGLSFPLGLKSVTRLLLLAALGGLALWLLGDELNLSFTLGRAGEFGAPGSSGYIRYVAPFRLIGDTINATPFTPWLGHGPGTISREVRGYEFHDPTWAKLLFEYGIIGFVLFLALFSVALRRPEVPIQTRATLFFAWLIMGGHLLSPEINFLTLALVGLVPRSPIVDPTAAHPFAGNPSGWAHHPEAAGEPCRTS